ncbi:RT0821/Lpp0805 family surface protein [Methylosinus sp. Sm6]|uniref:RT0821/Lpp0805 family surface protein n=1 Tax=Methylosinus sp. Sm6 TaxID=2866948 RepID=UPI002103297C|nr:RT0821/Lpp0805 family surface protein [Methylosinus sp. Sm6]
MTALSLASCSFAIPGGEPAAWSGNVSDEVTGSIRPAAPQLSSALDQEDRRRADAALGVALDPQGAGASVNWDNPQTQAKGSFTPLGPPYPSDGRVCRAFRAEVETKETHERLQGAACRERTADWALIEVRPWRKAGV